MSRLLAPLATPRIKAAVAQNLSKLRLVLEAADQHEDPPGIQLAAAVQADRSAGHRRPG
jgi:hypothetical protein